MTNQKKDKLALFYEQSLELVGKKDIFSRQFIFELANCYVRMDKFQEAEKYYSESLSAMFSPPKFWLDSHQVDWLIGIFILSGRKDKYSAVLDELDACESTVLGTYPIYFYAACLMNFLGEKKDIPFFISKLLEDPRIKGAVFFGEAFQAIQDHNETNFNQSLMNILTKHEGKAKHGELRYTAEGVICMDAMAIGFVGLLNNMKITLKSDYFSLDYLEYLLPRYLQKPLK